jgi:hypothetical protein
VNNLELFGRLLVFGGLITAMIGGLVIVFGRWGVPLGHLPGDIRIQGENVTCFIPIVSMIFLSIVLTIVLNVLLRLLRK